MHWRSSFQCYSTKMYLPISLPIHLQTCRVQHLQSNQVVLNLRNRHCFLHLSHLWFIPSNLHWPLQINPVTSLRSFHQRNHRSWKVKFLQVCPVHYRLQSILQFLLKNLAYSQQIYPHYYHHCNHLWFLPLLLQVYRRFHLHSKNRLSLLLVLVVHHLQNQALCLQICHQCKAQILRHLGPLLCLAIIHLCYLLIHHRKNGVIVLLRALVHIHQRFQARNHQRIPLFCQVAFQQITLQFNPLYHWCQHYPRIKHQL